MRAVRRDSHPPQRRRKWNIHCVVSDVFNVFGLGRTRHDQMMHSYTLHSRLLYIYHIVISIVIIMIIVIVAIVIFNIIIINIMCICCFFTYHMVLLSMAILLIVCLLLLLLLLLPLILLLWLYMCIRFLSFFSVHMCMMIYQNRYSLPSPQNFTVGTGRLPGLLLPGERWGNSDSPQWEWDLHGFNQPEMGISSGISWFTNPENIKTYTLYRQYIQDGSSMMVWLP